MLKSFLRLLFWAISITLLFQACSSNYERRAAKKIGSQKIEEITVHRLQLKGDTIEINTHGGTEKYILIE